MPNPAFLYFSEFLRQLSLCALAFCLALSGIARAEEGVDFKEESIRNFFSNVERYTPSAPTQLQATPQKESWRENPPDEDGACFDVVEVQIQILPGKFSDLSAGKLIPDGFRYPRELCIGEKRLFWYLQQLQQRLIELGFIEASTTVPEQELSDGRLTFQVKLKPIGSIEWFDGGKNQILPPSGIEDNSDQALNIRSIEQKIELVEKIPGHQLNAQISDMPGSDETRVVYEWNKGPVFTGAVFADDSGDDTFGRYQTGMQLSCGSCFTDLDILSLFVQQANGGKVNHDNHQDAWNILYQIPFNELQLSLEISRFKNKQQIEGFLQFYEYKSINDRFSLGLSKSIARNRSSQTQLSAFITQVESSNFIDEQEVEVQHRRTSSWLVRVAQRQVISNSLSINASIEHERGVGFLNSLAAPEQFFDEGTSRFQVQRLRASLRYIFEKFDIPFSWGTQLFIQSNQTPLAPQQRLLLGGRNDVRGYQTASLQGDRGGYVRNELGFPTPIPKVGVYVGMDIGFVGGKSASHLETKTLAGAAIGLRAVLGSAYFDSFISMPLSYPKDIPISSAVAGFSVTYLF
ncbi:ShlB/FhaC/HecB family hemolysin secretion/activation protein [Limnobacter sp.]|uniref:ShlB/FhaC/HecB family hemolysin secretion/activation protein n=1 Tax=Limnobacter sp. TaxID=2003368 RepID=UPI00391A1979